MQHGQLGVGCRALILLDLATTPGVAGKYAAQSHQPLTEDGSAVSGQNLVALAMALDRLGDRPAPTRLVGWL